MSISLYSIYANSCIELARSIIIKSEATSNAMNKEDAKMSAYLSSEFNETPFFDEYDPKTWRYYMHMAGQYHRLDKFEWTDITTGKTIKTEKIKIYSLDDYSYIDFTIENLKEHRSTWREYQKGSTYYQNLVNKYPNHRLLIDGILNPIDIDEAINARDNKILYYDKRFVEENEYSLIDNIQKYVDMFYSRWDNKDYEITNNLYVPARIGILYIYLPYYIMDIRYNKSRTIEAHSFHVWNYLGSHQWLDEFRYHLNLYQRMWFYRNIRWSEVNAGKLSTFRKHIDVIMTNRNLPISEFNSTMITTEMEADVNTMYPGSIFKRIPLNMPDHLTKADLWRDIPTMVDSEINEGRDNRLPHNLIIDKKIAEHKFTHSNTVTLSTKVVESSVNDNSKRAPIKKHDVELNEWIYMTTKGLYTARISIPNPVTGEHMNMSQREALIVFIYSLMRSLGIKPKLIPTLTATKVLKLNKPNIKDVAKLMSPYYTCYKYLYAADHYVFEPKKIISTEKFAEFCNDVYNLKNIHRNLYSFTQDYREHIQVKTITEQYYDTVVCQLTTEKMHFDSFFKYKGWVFDNSTEEENNNGGVWTRSQYVQLVNDITKHALGTDLLRGLSIKEVQGMMVRLLKKLSSYTIQFLIDINDEEINIVDWPYLRGHKLGVRYSDFKHLNMTNLDLYNLKAKLFHKGNESILGKPIHAGNHKLTLLGKKNLNLILDLNQEGKIKMRNAYRLPTVSVYNSKLTIHPPKPKEEFNNPWEMDKFRIHKTTENRSRVDVDRETGELIVQGVVYVKDDYKDE